MGTRADLPPPGSVRFITQPTQLSNNSNVKITSQHAEIWYNGNLMRRIVSDVVVAAELPFDVFVVNPLGNTIIEGEGPSDFSIAKTVCHALFAAGSYDTPVLRAVRPPVFIKGSTESGQWEQVFGDGIDIITEAYGDSSSVLDSFIGAGNPIETLTAPGYAGAAFPVWVKFAFANVNGFRFSLGGSDVMIIQCPLLQIGAAVYAQYEWWMQMWAPWDLIEAYVIYPLGPIEAADRFVQTTYLTPEHVRFQSAERFDKVSVTAAPRSSGEQHMVERAAGREGRRRSSGAAVTLPFGMSGEETS